MTNRGKKAAGLIVRTQGEVAAFFGKATRTIGEWRKDGCPGKPGRYDLREIAAWVEARRGDRRSAKKSDGPDSYDHHNKEWKKWQARLREIEVLEREGNLIARSEVDQLLVSRIVEVRQALLGLGNRLSDRLAQIDDAREIAEILDHEARHLCERFARSPLLTLDPTEVTRLLEWIRA